MANHRDACSLQELSCHSQRKQKSIKGKRKRHMQGESTNIPKSNVHYLFKSSSSVLSRQLSLNPSLSSSSRQHSRSWRGNWFILPFITVTFMSCQVWATTFTIALVGPWTCDRLYSKALPDLAARLATYRMNQDPFLKKGYWYDYTIINEDCKSSRALPKFGELEGYGDAFLGPANPGYCSSAALYAKEWDVAILSWACLKPNMEEGKMYPTFLRPLPLSSRVLFTVLHYFRWAHVAIISEDKELWEATGNELATSLRALGLPVHPVVVMEADKDGPRRALAKVREADRVRVIIMCMPSVFIGGQAQYHLLTVALAMRMIDRGFVFIPYDTLLYSLPYKNTSYHILSNDTKLRKAYDGVLTITVDSRERNFYEAFRDAHNNYEISSSAIAEEVSPFFGTIYNMMYYIGMAVEHTRSKGNRWVTGHNLLKDDSEFTFKGFNQHVWSGKNGEGMQTHYVVLDYSGSGSSLTPTHLVEAEYANGRTGSLKYLGRSVHFAGTTPYKDSTCWFRSESACTGDLDLVTLLFFSLLFIPLAGTGVNLFLRLKKRGTAGLNFGEGNNGRSGRAVLTLEDLVFINTQVSKRKLNEESIMKSQLDMKTPHHSVSGRSYLASTPDSSNVAVFEGDWVWLKKCPSSAVSAVNSSTLDIFVNLRDMRQENLNLFLGLFFDSGIFGVVIEHCTRGSLEDLLNNEDVRLDWMFKSSLLMDLIRGMKYLHNRDIIHGRLKSRNCVVDGRFVLKVTDYGFNEILISQGIDVDVIKPEDLLWTAPELLRSSSMRRRGTFFGDVYSFAIIVQEVISRSAPFCMLDMHPKEIISKVREPPPLCRPIVSVDEAPIEVIQVMKQAWSEEPYKRPTFEEIFKQFKSITKGKKTNIIDSMLRMLEQYSSNLEDLIRERTEELEVERQKTDNLVAQMLPKSVAQALKTGKPVKPEHFSEVTLYFSDIVGFTTISALSEPIEVVDLLNDLYTLFDAIIGMHDVYKVETIGDAYMVASGVPARNGSRHAAEMANMSLDILHCIGTFKMRHMPELKVRIRIGLHSGPVVAGVVGLTMPRYCLFGDTVNTASRMESTGLPYRIHVNQSTVDILNSLKLGYQIQLRGLTELKGKGVENTYWLVGREDFNKPLPIPPDIKGGSNHGINLEEIPVDRRQKFLDRQKRMG
ncbi:retinal guanylyl cyclase 1 [Thalassophryne amazonica]|uniref:retinal guanylyl cyclase 1 n=1 Tax=Thalassophryne amazonica TaxID=390379 RepID=UPI001470A43B|nr:retinal guanylyl cyclase 1 [Thalassophryne amazonica]